MRPMPIILSVGNIDQRIKEDIQAMGGTIHEIKIKELFYQSEQTVYLVQMPELTSYETDEGRHIYVIQDAKLNTLAVYELYLPDNQNVLDASLAE